MDATHWNDGQGASKKALKMRDTLMYLYMCGVREVERARGTECTGCPDVCRRNSTSLLAAAGLRSLRGRGSSSCFG